MIIIDRKLVRVAEYWFDEELVPEKADVFRYMQRSSRLTNLPCKEFHTVIVDLEKDEDSLLAGIKKETRYEIRRAASKDALKYVYNDSSCHEMLQAFIGFYNKFAVRKRIPTISGRRLFEYASAGALVVSKMNSEDGGELVWHVYFNGGTRVRLLYSASSLNDSADAFRRSLIGRANRYHHLRDMLKFKSDGVSIYDFGGWYAGNQDHAKQNINDFKEGWGGVIVKNFNYEIAHTIKGLAYLSIRDVVNALRVRSALS